jgi:hypothetical protein
MVVAIDQGVEVGQDVPVIGEWANHLLESRPKIRFRE